MDSYSKRAQLNYYDIYQLKWILGTALALISLWTLFLLEMSSGPIIYFTGLAMSVAFLFPRLIGKISPYLWKVIPYALAIVIAIDFLLSSGEIIPPLIRMVTLLLLIRTVQFRKRREDLQLILLCLFVIIITGVLSQSITFAFQVAMFMPCALWLLFIINLSEAHDESAVSNEKMWKHFSWKNLGRRIWRVIDFRLLLFFLGLFAGSMAVSSLIFVALPRVQLDRAIPFLKLQPKQTTGFSDSISFGDVTDIIEDQSNAFSVDLDGLAPPASPYWRMVVFDEYYYYRDKKSHKTLSSFRQSTSAKYADQNKTQVFHRLPPPSQFRQYHKRHPNKWTFYIQGGNSKYLPFVGLSSGIKFPNSKALEINRVLHTAKLVKAESSLLSFQHLDMMPMSAIPSDRKRERELVARFLNDIRSPYSVPFESRKEKRIKASYPHTTLEIPAAEKDLEYLQSVVAEITQGEKLTAIEFSLRAINYLNSAHQYSLKSKIPTTKDHSDILVRWMNSNQPGHCELFAGAFTLLARTAGYPTRVVAGFKGGVWNAIGEYYMIRNKDAHAWCEIFDVKQVKGPRGRTINKGLWYRVDPTPGSSSAAGHIGESVREGRLIKDSSWKSRIDSIRIFWYRQIVNFDDDSQKQIASNLKTFAESMLLVLKEDLLRLQKIIQEWFSRPWKIYEWLAIIGTIVGSILLFLIGRLLWFKFPIQSLFMRNKKQKVILDPIQKKAGKLVVKFRSKTPELGQNSKVSIDEWHLVYHDLLYLRFGPKIERPQHKPVFQRARNLLKLT